jgi:hypothetical protein
VWCGARSYVMAWGSVVRGKKGKSGFTQFLSVFAGETVGVFDYLWLP